jgi:hypothetical protein
MTTARISSFHTSDGPVSHQRGRAFLIFGGTKGACYASLLDCPGRFFGWASRNFNLAPVARIQTRAPPTVSLSGIGRSCTDAVVAVGQRSASARRRALAWGRAAKSLNLLMMRSRSSGRTRPVSNVHTRRAGWPGSRGEGQSAAMERGRDHDVVGTEPCACGKCAGLCLHMS